MLQDQPLDITRLHAAYAAGLDPRALLGEVYRRIEALADPGIFLHLRDPDTVAAEAAALGPFDARRRPLWGLPFAVKDNIDAAGTPTTAGCPAYSYHAERDAFVVEALRSAGALLIGKTNLDQFATGLVGLRTPYPPPRNALDAAIVPGGSSSGSAVAVAQGLLSFTLGTDTAGSGRVPAALNNIVGLKPSLGALSSSGVVPACRSLDTVSIFALCAEDAYAVLRSAARYDAADSYARRLACPPLGAAPAQPRIGVPDAASQRFFGDTVQAGAFAAALGQARAAGAELVALDFSDLYAVAALLYEGAWVAERYAAVAHLLERAPEALHPVTRRIIEQARELGAVDVYRDLYRLQDLKRRIEPLLASVDVLCVPSIPTFYTVDEVLADPYVPNARLGTYTNFVNLLDLCAIAVPMAPRSDGRPGSVTLLGGAGEDATVAALACELQRRAGAPLGATGWTLPPAPPRPAQPAADEVALAVVGAHMSGLPLNHELRRLGGRFLRCALTAPEYRLYSLPGGPPARPGLLRQADGAAIAVEVWALPAARIGEFLSGVPAPLAIGTVRLADGDTPRGFLCEACAVAGAEDITRHGGWRAYLQSQPAA